MLTINELNVNYGAIRALQGVSIAVESGEIVAIIGANGAGKSTLLRAVSGLVKPASGTMALQTETGSVDLARQKPHQIVQLGVAHAPEGRRIFTNMTVAENLQLGAYTRKDADVHKDTEAVLERFPRLRERLKQSAGTLSGGEQQMLAIGRALLLRPRLLLLDEPSLGLAPFLVKEIFNIVRDINADGTTVLLVEQNAHMALEIAHRGYVLETGKVALSDTGKALLASPAVKEAYLGGV